tara:strand:+ start:2506 stop:3534 length:1029 start_codon:yes stop_codon:yes gene_type:complete
MAIQEGNERMRRVLREEENAVTHVIEFTIALTVFVLLLQAFISSMNHRIGIDLDENDEKVAMVREAISELAGSEGKIGEVTNWEDFEFGTGDVQLRNGVTVGLLNSNGEIDKDKCEALGKFPYFDLKDELEIVGQLRIEIRTIVPDESVCLWGGNPEKATLSIKSERYILYNTGSAVLPATLTVTIFEGGEIPGNKIYMTEVMYNPEQRASDYEWIEIYNPNSAAIYFTGWKISDSEDDDLILPENEGNQITLPAKGVGILTSSPATYKETHGNYEYVFSVEDTAIGDGLGEDETLTLSKGSFDDTYSYTSDDGANENGKTLTRSCYNCDAWAETVASPSTI